jgi:hypothetical protein
MKQTALQQLLDDKAALSLAFAIAVQRHVVESATSDQLGSAAAGTGRAGRVSLWGLNPETPDQKYRTLLKMLVDRDIVLSDQGSIAAISREVFNPENKNLDIDGLVKKLREEGMLKQAPKTPVHKPMDPRPLLGMAAAALAFASKRAPAPAFA